MAALRLIAIDRAGAPASGAPPATALTHEVCAATVAHYARSGYAPPWISYLAAGDAGLVGICSFKSAPRDGRAEIAYFTFPEFEGRGIATAMARALVAVAAAADPGVLVTAQTLPQTNASTRVLEKIGFERSGTAMDDEVGMVWEWELCRSVAEASPVPPG